MNAQRISPRDRARYTVATHPRFGLIVAIVVVLLLMAMIVMAAPAHAQETIPSISTDRPGQATPPAIAPPGYVQMEIGAQLASDASDGGPTTRLLSTPQALIRVGLLPTMELRVQGEFRTTTISIEGAADQSHGGLAGLAVGTKVGIKPAKSSGPGKYILIALGVVAVAGVAYAAWQTLRADDELWVSDDSDDVVEAGTPED